MPSRCVISAQEAPRDLFPLAASDPTDSEETGEASARPPAEDPAPATVTPPRLVALDAFRGLTIFGMLLVNNIALDWHTPRQLMHAPWNGGVHFADLVFPWFLLIVGVAIPYAWASHRGKGWGHGRYLLKALTRAVALVGIGCLIDSSIARMPLFDLDVLQLIGLAYFVGAAVAMCLPVVPRLALAAVFLLAHWYVIRHVPVPGMPTGTFEPNRNVIAYVNRRYLGPYHLAGLISVVPASALVLIGTGFGDLLRAERFTRLKRFLLVMASGAALMLLGSVWSRSLPFNKPVWTGSYILFCGGFGALLLGILYGLLDVKKADERWKLWALPLVIFGSNAIVAYVTPILVKLYILRVWTWPGTHVPLEQAFLHSAVRRWGPVNGGWHYTLGYIIVWWLVLAILYRRKIFLRV